MFARKIPCNYFWISSYGAHVLETDNTVLKKFGFLFVEDIILGSSALSNSFPVTTKKDWIFKQPIPDPWSRVLDKIIGPDLLKKFPVFSWIRVFLHHLQQPVPFRILSQINSIHAPRSHFLRYIWIFSYHPWPSLPNGLFPAGFPTNTTYASLLSP